MFHVSRRLYIRYSTSRHYSRQRWRKPAGRDTGIQIYNCTARRLVPLVLRNEYVATWYTCGPTVYDSTHIGHASCYVKLDIIQRVLRNYFGINLVTAMNITDIDDKIIQKSQETGTPWQVISKLYETEFWSDIRKLNVIEPNLKIRVTENIPQIIEFIEKIILKGSAYVSQDASVYFDVKKFHQYGKLQRLNFEQDNIAYVSNINENKKAALDFALWKARKITSEPSWPSPWGAGRPGWHIECSVLAGLIFGDTIDFHAGGLDLKFPHHENEEAQSCVFHDTEQWVNYWLHTGQLSIKGNAEKMSKSLKNTISIDQMLEKYSADDFRMACVLSNYRHAMEYSEDMMESAKNTLAKFKSFRSDCNAYIEGKKQTVNQLKSNEIIQKLNEAEKEFDACLKNDFNTACSVGILLETISDINRNINEVNISAHDTRNTNFSSATCLDAIAAVDNFICKCLNTFGFQFVENDVCKNSSINLHNSKIDVKLLLENILQARRSIRDTAVSTKNKELFEICDLLRNCLKESGVEVKDYTQGSSWHLTNKR